jgi:MscS family membrane protein
MNFLELALEFWWVLEFFAIFLVAGVAQLAISMIIRKLASKFSPERILARAFFLSALNPVIFSVWAYSFLLAYCLLMQHCPLPNILYIAFKMITLFTIGWFLLNLTRNVRIGYIEKWQKDSKNYDLTTIDGVSKLVTLSISTILLILIAQNLGLNLSGILAFGGIGGLAIGLAAKDLLANLFGALSIHWDRPFKVGDWIRSPDKEIEGTVEHIGWRLTRIRTFDKRPLYVPNALFSTISIENPSRMRNRRIKETIGIRYQDADKMHTIVNQIRNYLIENPKIDTKQTLIVNFNAFSAYSLDILIYTFTKTTKWIEFHMIKHDVLLDIYGIIRKNDGDLAYPTQEIHLDQNKT